MTIKNTLILFVISGVFATCKPKDSNSNNNAVKNNEALTVDKPSGDSPEELIAQKWKVTGSQYVGEEMTHQYNVFTFELTKDGKAIATKEGSSEKEYGTYKMNDGGKSIYIYESNGEKHYFEFLELAKSKLKVITSPPREQTHTFTLESVQN